LFISYTFFDSSCAVRVGRGARYAASGT
jgi:hypothetical protein